MKAREIMRCRVMSIRSTSSSADALALLLLTGFSFAPVLDEDGRLIGTVNSRTLLRACASRPARLPLRRRLFTRHAELRSVRTWMETPVVALTPGADVEQVADMLDHGHSAVLIVDGVSVVGIISRSDLAAGAPFLHLADHAGAPPTDRPTPRAAQLPAAPPRAASAAHRAHSHDSRTR